MEMLLIGLKAAPASMSSRSSRRAAKPSRGARSKSRPSARLKTRKVFTKIHLSYRDRPRASASQGRARRHIRRRKILLRLDHARGDGRDAYAPKLSMNCSRWRRNERYLLRTDHARGPGPAPGRQQPRRSRHPLIGRWWRKGGLWRTYPRRRAHHHVADGWRAKVGNAPGMLPPLDHLAGLVGSLGIKPHDDVVIVPAGVSATDFAAAARVYWTLKLTPWPAGHSRWRIPGVERRPVATGSKPVHPRQTGRALSCRRAAAAAQHCRCRPRRLEEQVATLVDARSASYFEAARSCGSDARRAYSRRDFA